ncbi:site-specific DNA-methyltransferase [Streptomyces spectabilis]|uniref:DNA-methyltransferase n=1 Tax=Streptomyces spectabilis TaxID=68270 RepID=UPI0033FB96A9
MTAAYYADDTVTLHQGDALDVLATMATGAADCIVTSPPYYGLRDYGVPGQYGLEETPEAYVATLAAVFAEAHRVLADDGTLWLNLGDSYSTGRGTPNAGFNERWHGPGMSGQRKQETGRPTQRGRVKGMPTKALLGLPWRVALAVQLAAPWTLRNDVIWVKPNAMPENVADRLSGRHEHLFMFTKGPRYWFDLDAIREPYTGDRAPSRRARKGANKSTSGAAPWTPDDAKGRNPGDVWTIATRPNPQAHGAVFPIDLPLRCIKAGCRPGGTVLDPFTGSSTTGLAARQLGHRFVGIDLNPAYLDLSRSRVAQGVLPFPDTLGEDTASGARHAG